MSIYIHRHRASEYVPSYLKAKFVSGMSLGQVKGGSVPHGVPLKSMEGPRGKKCSVLILSDNRMVGIAIYNSSTALIAVFLIFPTFASFLSSI